MVPLPPYLTLLLTQELKPAQAKCSRVVALQTHFASKWEIGKLLCYIYSTSTPKYISDLTGSSCQQSCRSDCLVSQPVNLLFLWKVIKVKSFLLPKSPDWKGARDVSFLEKSDQVENGTSRTWHRQVINICTEKKSLKNYLLTFFLSFFGHLQFQMFS